MQSAEVEMSVHLSRTEVRIQQKSTTHDFVRDAVRTALMKARPVPQFAVEINAHPTATPSLTPGARAATVDISAWRAANLPPGFTLQSPTVPPETARLQF